uniref:Integrase, catalytic region, zinc finger, CCHC-type, peptidase aspartic, catalytic n=1 Tax=Tanacetum cinerariifolium TaxID=118510 RepID=A0A6L2LZJ2_TANCI|nr:integrase, catalytic region, zinc finger, CCHC-type, peptidase aspartic, catalytic [Tanacetum cinerariifolium]
MSTQQDIYAVGSENRPSMINKDNYVPWSSRIIRYARIRPNGKMNVDSIENGAYVRRMIATPGEPDLPVPVQTLGNRRRRQSSSMNGKSSRLLTEEVKELRAERLAKSHDLLALMAHSQNLFNFPITHKDQSSSSTHPQQSFLIINKYNPQPSLNQKFMQPPMTSLEDVNYPTKVMNAALILCAKAFQHSSPTNNNQRTSSNPRNRQLAQPVMNMGQDRLTQNVGGNGGNQFGQYAGQVAQNQMGWLLFQGLQTIVELNGGIQGIQNAGMQSGGNQNGLVVVPGIANHSGTGNVVAARAKGDLDEIEKVNANCILMANLQQASTSGNQHDRAPVYDTDGSAEVVQICLWCVDSGCSKHMTRNIKLLINFVWKFLGTVRFENDHIAAILGYGNLKWGNITITRVYFIEGLGHNLFSVGQFCDADLDVAFRRNTCFIRDLDGVDLLKGNRSTNLYTINLYDMASTSPICLMARATPTKSWLWHQRLSHLNFDTINDLAKNDLVSGLPKFKYAKEHLCPSCEQGKSKRASHPPKSVPNSKQQPHLLHINLCCPMRVASINGKRNRTLVEAARTMLIFSHAPLFLWAEAIATVSYTQNRSIIHRHFNKTPYELIQGRKPDISYLHVFGALCYPKNDREDVGKLGAKGDIGFFIGYSANSVAYRVYNRRTRKIMETMNVTIDELLAMAFEQNSSRPGLQCMTSGQISS